jgi:rubrerythrin
MNTQKEAGQSSYAALEGGYTGASFDLQDYLQRSAALDLTGIDFSQAADHALSEGEVRCLTYMMDIESHTLCYLNDVLNAGAGADPEIADFLGCWLYEESYHGRAIERFLRAAGVARSAAVCGQRRPTPLDRLEAFGTRLISRLFPQAFLTTYMTWGAVQEHLTLFGYTNLAQRTSNPVLAELLKRIAKQESRHFGFYYYKAHQGLSRSPFSRRLTGTLLKLFWRPVGEGVKSREDADFLMNAIFSGPEGRRAMERVDRTMARLPGMDWFDMMSLRCAAAESRAC